MKVAVTGGSGQLGGAVLRRLIDDRAVKSIVSIDVRPPAHVNGKLRWAETDVRDPKVADVLEGCDALFHIAFVTTQRMPRAQMEDINVGGSKNMFRAAAAKKLKKIIYASSIAAYGISPPGGPEPITEDRPRIFHAPFPYAADKYNVEAFLDDLEREAGPDLWITRFRPSVLFGARMQNPLAKLMSEIMRHGFFLEMGGPAIPLVWDEDVADAMMLALKKDVRGAFNVSADEPASSKQLAEAGGLKLVYVPDPALTLMDRVTPWLEKLGIGEAADSSWRMEAFAEMKPSSERAKTVLGWKPRCPRAVDVIKRFMEVTPGRTDPRLTTLFRIINMSGISKRPFDEQQMRGLKARIHLHLTGKGGGDFAINVADERVRILFELPRPPTSVATLPCALFLDMLAGRASFATAQLTGRVRIEGDPIAAFMLGSMVARYQQLDEFTGVRGFATRALTRWINQGGAS